MYVTMCAEARKTQSSSLTLSLHFWDGVSYGMDLVGLAGQQAPGIPLPPNKHAQPAQLVMGVPGILTRVPY